jgi:hypothetical protein
MTEPALYTPATLARIRAGASASDIGWPDERYNRICDMYGIERRAVVAASIIPKSVAISSLSYNPSTGIVHRGYCDVLLYGTRERAIFEYLLNRVIRGLVIAP